MLEDICVVIVGQITRGFDFVIRYFSNAGMKVIIVTSQDYKDVLVGIDSEVIYIDHNCLGYGNRNIQRLQICNGLKRAAVLGYKYTLKWRTDLLPVRLNFQVLLELCEADKVEFPNSSKIVTSLFRHLHVYPDDFSSLPDLFMFGRTLDLLMLWDVENFDYKAQFNIPDEMLSNRRYFITDNWIFIDGNKYFLGDVYDNHTELYAILKYKLRSMYNCEMDYEYIYKNLFHGVSSKYVDYCWFHRIKGFRPTMPAPQFPWKSRTVSYPCLHIQSVGWEYKHKKLYRLINPILARLNIANQHIKFLFYRLIHARS